MKKCPVCNSTKYKQNKNGSRCNKCGYENKTQQEKITTSHSQCCC